MTIDISPEAVEHLWRFWANKAQALADENKALSAALTQSQDHLDRWINTCAAQGQTIFELQEALTASQAETAAAYAAVKVKPLDLSNLLKHAFLSGVVAARNIPGWDECEGTELWVDYDPTNESSYERILAALTPADSKAALDRMLADARADGKSYVISGLSGPLWRLILKEEGCFDKPCDLDDCICRKQHDHLLKFAEKELNVPKGKGHE